MSYVRNCAIKANKKLRLQQQTVIIIINFVVSTQGFVSGEGNNELLNSVPLWT